jgi:hypothetical protein
MSTPKRSKERDGAAPSTDPVRGESATPFGAARGEGPPSQTSPPSHGAPISPAEYERLKEAAKTIPVPRPADGTR